MRLLVAVVAACSCAAHEPLCRPGEPAPTCKITGEGCDEVKVTFQPYNLTVMKWDGALKKYQDKPVGRLESHVAVGGADDWQMYLHGPMLRPQKEQGDYSMPPFYVSATFTNKVYRFEQIRKSAVRGQNMTAIQKVVAHAVAPSTTFPIENKDGDLEGLLVAEGEPFDINSPLDPKHMTFDFGGVDYVSPNNGGANCTRIFPNAADKVSNYKTGGDVTNTVSCHPHTGICFFSVWRFYDDAQPMWNLTKKKHPDCLHYCVVDDITKVAEGCKKAGVVMNEYNQPICSQPGVGAVHGMTVSTVVGPDPNEFDIFLVFTGGVEFVGGESSMKKLRVQVTGTGSARNVSVLSSQDFGSELFRSLPAPGHDIGGDHAWVDATGEWVWVSTFRTAKPGVHLLSYSDGALHYSVTGMSDYVPNNYAYSAGIHGVGTLGEKGSYLAVATSACTDVKLCAPIPWSKPVPSADWAKGVMFVIDLSGIHPPNRTLP